LQQSYSNSSAVLVKIPTILDGVGRSNILPRQTTEHRFHLADTMSFDGQRNSWKFGGDALFTTIYDFFPSQQSGEYLFYPIKVDPTTFYPTEGAMQLTPLRAFAHGVPHYYLQNFGSATSHPDTNEYAAFAQDTVRVTNHLAVNIGARWDLQTFTSKGLVSNPLFPPSGKVSFQPYNFAPRAGFAYSIGTKRPFVLRGGYGIFYVRIAQIYNSVIQTHNGITDSQVFLSNTRSWDRQVFPAYPNPLVNCPLYAADCSLPDGFTQGVTHNVSAFATNFVTPRVQQSSVTLAKEVVDRTTVSLSLLNVRGEHLIRALDVNLPQPTALTYPISIPRDRFFRMLITPSIRSRHGSSRALWIARGPRASILWDVPSRNWVRSMNFRVRHPPITTGLRFRSTAVSRVARILGSRTLMLARSMMGRMLSLRDNRQPCRTHITRARNAVPALPTRDIGW
jgi:hypothetical protein